MRLISPSLVKANLRPAFSAGWLTVPYLLVATLPIITNREFCSCPLTTTISPLSAEGSAGLVAVYAATALDLKTVLIEKTVIGGDCTWTGCVPSKALIKAAKVAHQARNAAHYGINVAQSQTDMKRVRQYVMDSIQTIYHHETPEVIAELGAEVIIAPAEFLDAHTIRAGDRTLATHKTIIATGAKPAHPAIDGLEAVNYFTYHTLWENERLPDHLLVIGAGAVGVELGQAYRRLGAQVTIIDVDLLPKADPDAREVLCDVFAEEGIRFVEGLVRSASQQGSEITPPHRERNPARRYGAGRGGARPQHRRAGTGRCWRDL